MVPHTKAIAQMSGVASRSPGPIDLPAVPKADSDLSQSTRLRRVVRPEARPAVQRLGQAQVTAAPRIPRLAGPEDAAPGYSNGFKIWLSLAKVLPSGPAARAVFARLLPASVLLPPATGLLVLCGVQVGLYTPSLGFAIFTALSVLAFTALSWETAWLAAQVEGALQRSNAGLLAARLRAEETTRAKSRFLAGMSHELRTPLHAILGYAELLSTEGALRATQAARVMQMRATGRHLLETINGVLAISEIEAGRVVLRPRVTALRHLAAECIDLVRPAAAAKGLELRVEATPDLPETIVADATRLRQIVVNLLGNAVKFTDRGRVTLGLRVGGEACVRIEVADTGRGIPPARLVSNTRSKGLGWAWRSPRASPR